MTGSAGQALPSGMTLIVALYDKDGRFMTLQMPTVATDGSFSTVFFGVPETKTVKAYLWSGLADIASGRRVGYGRSRMTEED